MDGLLIVVDGTVPERGLPNYGNTCYINAVLQIVVHLDAEFLGSHAPGAECTQPCAGCLLYHFLIKYRAGLPLNLEHLTRDISCFQKDFVRKEMDDCYLFWLAVAERLPPSGFKLSYCYKRTCRECNFQKIIQDQNCCSYSIPLVIGVELNVFESLDTYLSSSVKALECDCCGSNSGLLENLQLDMLPNVLAFQVGRYDDNGKKYNGPYSFPLFLDMKHYIGKEGFFYTLHGVIVHKGPTRHDGHYVCCVKSDHGWVYYSDDSVDSIEEYDVLGQRAYMLVYWRDKASTSANCSKGKDDFRTDTFSLPCHGSHANHGIISDSGNAEASTSASLPSNLIPQFVGMGFPKRIVEKAIQETGESNTDLVLEFLLKRSAVDKPSSECDNVPYDSGHPIDAADSSFESEDQSETFADVTVLCTH